MERLLKYCLQELSFEGDSGCGISDLPKVIGSFYDTPDGKGAQAVDDDYVSYVWSLFIRLSGVRIGIRSDGAPDIWVAPNASRNKIKNITPKAELQAIGDKLFTSTFSDLATEFGDSLRVAADRDVIFETLTGSHVQPSKLSDMAYTVLQLIARTRDAGMPVDDMTKTTGYSSGTLFYLVKTLQDLGLILKLRAGGLATNMTIHRHFWERSPTWQRVYAEELEQAMSEDNTPNVGQEEQEDAETDEKDAKLEASKLHFDPIDARFLSSTQLVRSRVIKLLKNSQNQTHFYPNLIFAIGCRNPSQTDRRFFTLRIRDGIRDGLWEKIAVPGAYTPDRKRRRDVFCLRLLSDTPNQTEHSRAQAQADETEDDLDCATPDPGILPLWDVTIHRQVTDLLEKAGDLSVTINDVSEQLGQFDKRTLEHLLDSFAATIPSPHLLDYGIVSVLQHFGRERRHEYWTIPAFRRTLFSSSETADLPQHLQDVARLDLSDVGQFSFHDAEEFYEGNEEMLSTVVDDYDAFTYGSSIGKRAREQKKEKTGGVVKPRGRPRKYPPPLEDAPPGPKKKGRPRKHPEAGSAIQTPKKRGRPRKFDVNDKPVKKNERPPKQASTLAGRDKPSLGGSPSEDVDQQSSKQGDPGQEVRAHAKVASPARAELVGGDLQVRPSCGEGESAPLLAADIGPVDSSSTRSRTFAGPPASPKTKRGRVRKVPDTEGEDLPQKRRRIAPKTQPARGSPTRMIGPSLASAATASPTSREGPPPHSSPASTAIAPLRARESSISAADHLGSQTGDATASLGATARPPGKSRKAMNITAMRRREEFIRVLEMTGGIANSVSSDFIDQHTMLLSTITARASAPPGTSMDRRTMKETFETMVGLNMVTSTSFSVNRVNGSQRPVTIWTLPHVSRDTIERHMDTVKAALGYRPAPTVKKLTAPIAYERSTAQKTKAVPTHRMVEEGLQIADMEDPEERRAWIMLEPRVVLQSAGYISGRFARVKELHLFLLAQMEREDIRSSCLLSKRIFRREYLWEDIPFGAYCSQIPPTEINEKLNEYLASEMHRWAPTNSVPMELSDVTAVGKTRCRQQFRLSLELLQKLGIVTPLTLTDSATPFIICGSLRFDILAEPSLAEYWRFNDVAPLYKFHKTPQDPPFVMNADISTEERRLKFWHQLQHMSLHPTPDVSTSDSGPPYAGGGELVRAIIKSSSWDGGYVLSPLQKEHLMSLINQTTGEHGFGDEGYIRVQEYVTGAPRDAIRRFVDRKTRAIRAAAERIRKKERQEALERERRESAKRVLAAKAAEVRQRLQREWEQLLKSLCPGNTSNEDVSRLTAIREDFFRSGGRLGGNFKPEKLAARVYDVLGIGKSHKLAPLPAELSEQFRNPRQGKQFLQAVPRPQLLPGGRSVYDLINAQDPRPERISRKKAKNKAKLEAEGDGSRKKRFKWNSEYDELAVDAMTIIRVRAQNAECAVDLEPLRQVFPGIDRNGVRSRIRRIVGPIEGYVRRLGAAWGKLWLEARGTDRLSDEDPNNLRDFDLAEHIIFLRQHIDKESLRAGLEAETSVILPHTVHDLLEHFDCVKNFHPDKFRYDFLQILPSDELREKEFTQEAFTWPPAPLRGANPRDDEELVGRAMGLIKMTISTDEAKFDQDGAERLLKDIESTTLEKAHDELRHSYIALVEGKRRPGRAFRYQDSQHSLIYGVFPDTLYKDADEQEGDLYAAGDWLEWPLTGSDGSVAALVTMVSDMKLSTKVGAPCIGEVKELISDNSKKIADEHIECMTYFMSPDNALRHSFSVSQSPVSVSGPLPIVGSPLSSNSPHRINMAGLRTRCTLDVDYVVGDVIQCQGCLDKTSAALLNPTALPDRSTFTSLFDTIRRSASQGVTISGLLEHGYHLQDVHRAINSFSTCSPPLAYCIAYGCTPRIISATYIRTWTAIIRSQSEHTGTTQETLVLPRRWRDIHGDTMYDIWRTALKAVFSTVISRPGIPESELVTRLRNVFDRPEITEALDYLRLEGFLKRIIDEELEIARYSTDVVVGCTDETESSKIYWLPTNTHPWWYIHHHGGS